MRKYENESPFLDLCLFRHTGGNIPNSPEKSALKEHNRFLKEYLNPYVIGGYALTGISMLLTILAFRGMEYKNGPIIEALGFVLVMFFGLFVFREKLTKKS